MRDQVPSTKRKILLFLFFSHILMVACTPTSSNQQEEVPETSSSDTHITKVSIDYSNFSTLAYRVQSSGRIVPHFTELLLSERSGLLLNCRAHNNQAVKKDEIIATLESTSVELRREKLLIQQYNAHKNTKVSCWVTRVC